MTENSEIVFQALVIVLAAITVLLVLLYPVFRKGMGEGRQEERKSVRRVFEKLRVSAVDGRVSRGVYHEAEERLKREGMTKEEIERELACCMTELDAHRQR